MTQPTNPCHTCRRRRVKCDLSVPFCQKCVRNGRECLGYGEKLFIWNRGLASRGKLMGKTYSFDQKKPPLPSTRPLPGSVHVPYTNAPMYPILTDPHLQGLDTTSQYYMYYFGSKVCNELVLYNNPMHNPFNTLISRTSEFEILRHITAAIAAIHLSRTELLSRINTTDVDSSQKSDFYVDEQLSSEKLLWHPLKDPYRDALREKQKALHLLAKAMKYPKTYADVAFMCVLLFVKFELMHPESTESHVHLQGARTLLDISSLSEDAKIFGVKAYRNSVLSDHIIYDVMEHTLIPSRPWDQALSSALIPILESLEISRHLPCPLEFIQMALKFRKLLRQNTDSGEAIRCESEEINSLVECFASFDIPGWAYSFLKVPWCESCPTDSSVKVHVGEAQKMAYCIFTIRVANVSNQADRIDHYISQMIKHLSLVPPEEPLYKTTSWPTFIAGLESNNQDVLDWSLSRLRLMRRLLPWGYIERVVRILKTVKRGDGQDGMRGLIQGNWTQGLRMALENYPIVL